MTSSYSSAGVVLDRYADILDRLETLAKAAWGQSIDLSEDEFLGHFYRTFATLLGEINQVVQDIYDARSISNATGTALDNLVAIIGMKRSAAAYSTAVLTLTASVATTVVAGSQYKTAAGVIFETDEDLVFTAAGSDTVTATCTEVGPYNAAIGEINTIVTSTYGITAVTNAAAASPGRVRELDALLKERHTAAVETTGSSSAAKLFQAVSEVTGVSSTYVFDNDTTEIAADNTPAGHVHVVAIGGTDAAVAEAILNNKTLGTHTYGATTVSVYDNTTSQAFDINFDRGTQKAVHIILNGTKAIGVFPDDGETQIKTALIDFFTDNFRLGDDVIYTELYRPIYSVAGFTVTSMFIAFTDPPAGTSNLSIGATEIATLAPADIDLTVT